MTLFELRGPDGNIILDAARTGGTVEIKAGSKVYTVGLEKGELQGFYTVRLNKELRRVKIHTITNTKIELTVDGEAFAFGRNTETPLSPSPGIKQRVDSSTFVAPLPGRVVSLSVREGQTVKEGEALVIVESMKMESIIKSDRRARVKRVIVKEGEAVRRGQALIIFD